LLGGAAGRARVAEADDQLSATGVVEPRRMAALLAPPTGL
jgi:hypothetical protein